MQKKRIIFTVTNDLNYDQRMQKICTSLSNAGFEVLLVGRKRKNSSPLKPEAFLQHRLYVIFEKGKLFYLEYNIRLFFYLLFKKADIFGAVDLDTILPCLFAAKIRAKKITYDAHEYFTEVPEVVNRPQIKKIWQWVEKFAVPKTDLCYTVCNSLAQLYMAQYKNTFHVIKNVPALNAQKVIPHISNGPKMLLYQGALNMGRGLAELLYAMKQLPVQLKIAGEGDLSTELRELAQELELGDKVEFLGLLEPQKLRELTPKAYAGYNLLENLGKSYYYSLANKFFDYIHAEVPVITNDFPEYAYINKEYEVAVLTNLSVENIVLSVERLLKDEAYYRRLKNNCVAAKQQFNWQKEEKQLVALYEGIC